MHDLLLAQPRLIRYRLFPDEGSFVFVLERFGDRKDLAVHDDVDAGREQSRGKQALSEVLQPVAAFKAEGRHGSGQDDGRLQIGEGETGK